MARGDRAADGRIYWGHRPAEIAAECITHAAGEGFNLELRPDTPVVVAEPYAAPGLESGTWGDIESLARRWGDLGCAWVNLRFAVDAHAQAIVRFEAKPSGSALPAGGIPACNGGFDCYRLFGADESWLRHPHGHPRPLAYALVRGGEGTVIPRHRTAAALAALKAYASEHPEQFVGYPLEALLWSPALWWALGRIGYWDHGYDSDLADRPYDDAISPLATEENPHFPWWEPIEPEILFPVLAPFVEPARSIVMRGPRGALTRWDFDGVCVRSVPIPPTT